MKFKLSTSANLYLKEPNKEEIEKLKSFGFKFHDYRSISGADTLVIECDEAQIEIDTLEELIEFSREWGKLVIDENSIEIYNSYRE